MRLRFEKSAEEIKKLSVQEFLLHQKQIFSFIDNALRYFLVKLISLKLKYFRIFNPY